MLMLRLLELLPVALLIAGCATNQSREMILLDTYTSNEIKRLQSSPYEVSTWAWLRGISGEDIHAIETLVAQHSAIRKPILRMFAVKNDRVQVMTGRDEYRGDIYNSFHVVKRDGKWGLEESRVEDIRASYDLQEIRRRGGIEHLTNR
jgi:hypothetical protein